MERRTAWQDIPEKEWLTYSTMDSLANLILTLFLHIFWFYIFANVICMDICLWYNIEQPRWVFPRTPKHSRYHRFELFNKLIQLDEWKLSPLYFFIIILPFLSSRDFHCPYMYYIHIFLVSYLCIHLIACVKDWFRESNEHISLKRNAEM